MNRLRWLGYVLRREETKVVRLGKEMCVDEDEGYKVRENKK